MLLLRVSGLAALVLSAIGLVSAQDQYSIDPESVDIATRNVWCSDQQSSCPLLCLQYPDGSMTTAANDCDAELLTYTCVCENGQSPNMTEYSLTLPFFICRQWGQQCVAGCGGVNTCQSSCLEDHPCGAQDPTRVNATSTAKTATATGAKATVTGADAEETAPVVYDGFGSDSTVASEAAAETSVPSAAQAALDLGRSYGLPTVFAGLFAVFSLIM